MTTELSEGDQVSIDVWNQTVEVLEVREGHDEVLIQMNDGTSSWEGLTWLNIQGEVVA